MAEINLDPPSQTEFPNQDPVVPRLAVVIDTPPAHEETVHRHLAFFAASVRGLTAGEVAIEFNKPLGTEVEPVTQRHVALVAEHILHSRAKTRIAQYNMSPREEEITWLIVQGRTNKAIAEELFLTEATIKGYVSSILSRMNVPGRAGVTHRLYFA